MSIDNVTKSKKGRPSVDTEAVTFRLSREIIVQIDEFRRSLPDLPSRTEAIRRLIEKALSN